MYSLLISIALSEQLSSTILDFVKLSFAKLYNMFSLLLSESRRDNIIENYFVIRFASP